MEDHEFCDDCKGCRPALAAVDLETGEVGGQVPDSDPAMVIINELWDNETTYAQRKAFIEVTLHNSQIPVETNLATQVMTMIEDAISGIRVKD